MRPYIDFLSVAQRIVWAISAMGCDFVSPHDYFETEPVIGLNLRDF
jgi:hypothetical protein